MPMFSSRMRLVAAAALLALPITGLGVDKARPEPKDTDEYKRAALVVDGQVTSVSYLNEKDEEASQGLAPRYRLVLKVSAIRKVREASAEVGGDVKVLGWAMK